MIKPSMSKKQSKVGRSTKSLKKDSKNSPKEKLSSFRLKKSKNPISVKKFIYICFLVILYMIIFSSVSGWAKDDNIRNDYEEFVEIPEYWEVYTQSIDGDHGCFLGNCRTLRSSYKVANKDLEEEVRSLNINGLKMEYDSCGKNIKNFDSDKCRPILVNNEYRLGISYTESSDLILIDLTKYNATVR